MIKVRRVLPEIHSRLSRCKANRCQRSIHVDDFVVAVGVGSPSRTRLNALRSNAYGSKSMARRAFRIFVSAIVPAGFVQVL